jgi:hypothetical protein
MEIFHDISDIVGGEDFSAESCQAYLDQPLGSYYDSSDVLVPNLDCDSLNTIIKRINDCNDNELAGNIVENMIINI